MMHCPHKIFTAARPTKKPTHRVSKNVPHLTCYNLYIHGSIATIFGTMLPRK